MSGDELFEDEELLPGAGGEIKKTDSFLDAVLAMSDSEMPAQILFYPSIAQEIVSAYLEDCLQTAGIPWSLLEVHRGGAYSKGSMNRISVVCVSASIPAQTSGRFVRTCLVTASLHTTRDLPVELAARFFSTIMIALQPQNLLENLPRYNGICGYPVRVAGVSDEGESQQVSDRGRAMSKTFKVALACADNSP